MNFVILLCALIYLCIINQSEADGSTNKQCYKAKTCVHNNNEKCGVSGSGTPRRFLDTCDIFEFNCLKNTDFKKTSMIKCKHLQSLYKRKLHKGQKSEPSDEEFANNFDSMNPEGPVGSDEVNGNKGRHPDYVAGTEGIKGGDGFDNYGGGGNGGGGYDQGDVDYNGGDGAQAAGGVAIGSAGEIGVGDGNGGAGKIGAVGEDVGTGGAGGDIADGAGDALGGGIEGGYPGGNVGAGMAGGAQDDSEVEVMESVDIDHLDRPVHRTKQLMKPSNLNGGLTKKKKL